jgi:hypothetical protein
VVEAILQEGGIENRRRITDISAVAGKQ